MKLNFLINIPLAFLFLLVSSAAISQSDSGGSMEECETVAAEAGKKIKPQRFTAKKESANNPFSYLLLEAQAT